MRPAFKASAPPTAPRKEEREALRDLVRTLADEAGELAQCADRLQSLFGELIAGPPFRPTDALERAQTLDSLVQRLQGLEMFLGALGREGLEDIPADTLKAAEGLRLTRQADRLGGRRLDAGASVAIGDCDLF